VQLRSFRQRFGPGRLYRRNVRVWNRHERREAAATLENPAPRVNGLRLWLRGRR
jgi:hypothetical protein